MTFCCLSQKFEMTIFLLCSEFNMPKPNQIVLLKLMEALCQGRRRRSKRKKVIVTPTTLSKFLLNFVGGHNLEVGGGTVIIKL